jgi:hypothetical protein
MISAVGLALSVALLMSACASHRASSKKPALSSRKVRADAIRRAQVWEATDIAKMDLKAGPQGHGAFKPGETVTCTYVKKEMSGTSPKFTCAIPPDDEVKVKFGQGNGEVYAEVAATRLFWALGFPVDHMYPVRVVCTGCPPEAHPAEAPSGDAVVFESAAIERKLKGHVIETKPEAGWAWPELEHVDQSAGGASRAQRDALKLLAVLVQHTDSKPEQQRLLCEDEKPEAGAPCAHPVMMVNDLGQTFGRSNIFNRSTVGSVNLQEWSAAHVWADTKSCIGALPESQTGTLDHPVIHEEGRKFLAGLLMQLSDAQLHALFEVSRFPERTGAAAPAASVDAWVEEFKVKRAEIVSRTCPT